ncbi:prepilin peptidase [Calderihabitans maritimus]|uniref:Type 4 prepilin peptidase 1 n=1 Tax=Calderihabitans maritimus TaxID=1246530 RepID=A0A1Z5HX76_9FIRM|nr:A24 family peptidase [Calderihabitans maritimus]GAW94133.1 type 4 prepilin peptidase 1 [Calderihabitans maritimus]
MLWLFFFLLGTVVGSFLNLCIDRIPRGESVVLPPSRCDSCGRQLKFYDLVPVVSYLLLGGRCRYCRKKISPRQPLVELAAGFIFSSLYLYYGISVNTFKYLVLVSVLLVVFFIDLEHLRIPDRVVVAALLLGTFMAALTRELVPEALLGAAAGFLPLFFLAVVSRGGMGGGDVKLAGVLGIFLGWKKILLVLFLASCLAAAVGLLAIASGKKGRKDPLPFGPFLAVGVVIVLFWGTDIVQWYRYFLWD